jgi:hypothetical protein
MGEARTGGFHTFRSSAFLRRNGATVRFSVVGGKGRRAGHGYDGALTVDPAARACRPATVIFMRTTSKVRPPARTGSTSTLAQPFQTKDSLSARKKLSKTVID